MTRFFNTLKNKIDSCSIFERWLLFLGIICVSLTCVFIFTGSIDDFSSDSASYNILAREEFLSGNLYPEGWYDSTTRYGFGINFIMWLFSGFVTDQILLRNISIFIFYLLFIASGVYFSKTVLNNRSYLVFIPVLSVCFFVITTLVYSVGAYSYQIVLVVFLPALFLSLVMGEKSKRAAKLVSFCVIYSLYAHNSIAILQEVTLPLIAAVVIYIFLHTYKDRSFDWRKYKYMLFFTAGFVLIAVINLLFFKKVLNFNTASQGSYVNDMTVLFRVDIFLDNFSKFIQSVLFMFGFEFGKSLFSVDGIFSLIKMTCTLFLIVYFPARLVKRFKEQSDKMQMFIIYSIVHVAEVIFIILFGYITDYTAGARYLITSVCLLSILGGFYFYKYILKEVNVFSYISIIICGIYLIAGASPMVRLNINYSVRIKNVKSLSDFLIENDLTYGYATYWNAGKNSVLSDFKVQINPIWVQEQSLIPFEWLCAERFFDPETYDGKSFLLLTKEESETFYGSPVYRKFDVPTEVLRHNDYVIYVYPYNISMNDFNGDIRLDLNEELSFKADECKLGVFGSGWSEPEEWGVWTEGNTNVLTLDLPENVSGTLSVNIDMVSYNEPRDVLVYIGNHYLETINVGTAANTYSLEIPEEYYSYDSDSARKVFTIKFIHTTEYLPPDDTVEGSVAKNPGLGLTRLVVTP